MEIDGKRGPGPQLGCGDAGDLKVSVEQSLVALLKTGGTPEEIQGVIGRLNSLDWPENVRQVFVHMCVEEAGEGTGKI